MIDKIPWMWVIAGGSLCFTFAISYSSVPGLWLVAGLGLTLALGGTAHYIADLVRETLLGNMKSHDEPKP